MRRTPPPPAIASSCSRLAWDIAGSTFGSRQVLYERFFASDPVTRARALNTMYQKDAVMKRVRRFLDKAG